MEHYTWDQMEMEKMSECISRKIISGDKAMVAQVFLAKGAVVPEHFHESEQITYILEGALKFELEGREVVVGKGQVLRIPSNVPHRAVALEDTLVFFFQAEDGIRDADVTGVQRCALPISRKGRTRIRRDAGPVTSTATRRRPGR